VAELVGKMQEGMRASGNSAYAASEAFDANLDLAVKAGWAYMHRMLFNDFVQVRTACIGLLISKITSSYGKRARSGAAVYRRIFGILA
jgi:hypothetical protein